MIQLLDRLSILRQNDVFARFILDFQRAVHDPTQEYNRNEPGEMYFGDVLRYVSQEECDTMNAKELEEYNGRRDEIEVPSMTDKYLGETIYTFPENKPDTYVERLSNAMIDIATALKSESLIFLGEYAMPWLMQKNNYPPMKKAIKHLNSIGVTDTFNGGFQASGQELKNLSASLFWLGRCNANSPDCYWSAPKTPFVAHTCKNGNIHFYFYSTKLQRTIEKATQSIGMLEVENGECSDRLSSTGHLKGRKIMI